MGICNCKLVYTLSKKEVILDQEDSLMEVLKNHHLFKNLGDSVLKNLVEEMTGFQIESGTYIYREGEDGTCFFIILKGNVEVSVNGERKKVLSEHDCFGELALIHKCVRSTSIMALTDVELFVLDGALYRELNQNFMRMKIGDVLFYLDLIPWLKTLDHTSKTTLARLTVLQEFLPGQKITSILENEERIYIIKQGLVSAVCKFSSDKVRLYHRDYFGEKWIFADSEFEFKYEIYEATTLEKTSVYIIPKSSIEEALGMNYKELILRSFYKALISQSQFFMNFFVEKHFDDLFDVSCLKYYSKGQTVFDMNCKSNKKIVFMLEGGLVDVR
jgi:cGMP-dependent protein kinase 1